MTSKQSSIKAIKPKTIRTTLTLPSELLEATDLLVNQGKAKSRNEFVAEAIAEKIAKIRRSEIDAELAEMAQNHEYQAEIRPMEAEFASQLEEANCKRKNSDFFKQKNQN